MVERTAGRSGKIFFFLFLIAIVAAILATLLMANDARNLRLLLDKAGYPDLLNDRTEFPAIARAQTRGIEAGRKGNRLPAPRMALPEHTFLDLKGGEQHFVRLIRSDPRTLCDELKAHGFPDLNWVASNAGTDAWECSSLLELPAVAAEAGIPSSLFLLIKGDSEEQVTSFRVKLNIEHAGDEAKVITLASDAILLFLTRVRWENSAEILEKVRHLEAFDVQNFGSRLQMKKEFGETPRYNFLANRTALPRKAEIDDFYFDRKKWLPLTDENGVAMVDGMMAGESPGREGLTPP